MIKAIILICGLSINLSAQGYQAPLTRTYVTNVSSAGISADHPLYIQWTPANNLTTDINLIGSSITFINPGAITNPNYVQFNTAFTDGQSTGRLQWNNEDGTLEFGLLGDNVNLQIGQEQVVYARNAGAAILNGKVVRIKGETGGKPSIELADANDTSKDDHIIGVTTEDIGNNENGYVTSFGYVRGLNTNAFTAGDELYLSNTPGEFTNVAPAIPAKIIHIGHVIAKSPTNGVILVNVGDSSDKATFGDLSADNIYIATGPQTGYGVVIATPVFFVEDGLFWDDVRCPLDSAAGATIRPPTLKPFRKNLAGTSDGIYFYAFEDESVAGNEEELFVSVQMPHGWDGTAVEPHIHYSVTQASVPTTNDTIVMGIEYSCSNIMGTFPVTTIQLATTTVAAPYEHGYIDFQMISPPNGLSTICGFRIFRNSSSATDNFTGDVFGLEFDIHFRKNSFGSRQELIK